MKVQLNKMMPWCWCWKVVIAGFCDCILVLNYQLSQKLKVLGYDKFNHLINTSNTPPYV